MREITDLNMVIATLTDEVAAWRTREAALAVALADAFVPYPVLQDLPAIPEEIKDLPAFSLRAEPPPATVAAALGGKTQGWVRGPAPPSEPLTIEADDGISALLRQMAPPPPPNPEASRELYASLTALRALNSTADSHTMMLPRASAREAVAPSDAASSQAPSLKPTMPSRRAPPPPDRH